MQVSSVVQAMQPELSMLTLLRLSSSLTPLTSSRKQHQEKHITAFATSINYGTAVNTGKLHHTTISCLLAVFTAESGRTSSDVCTVKHILNKTHQEAALTWLLYASTLLVKDWHML